MGAYKQFLASDIVVTPFEVNKAFYFEGATALTAPVVGAVVGLKVPVIFVPKNLSIPTN